MQLASLIISKTVAKNLIKVGWLFDWSMASGAKILHDNQLVFDTAASQKLIDRYLEVE
jgi:hypothetical protein